MLNSKTTKDESQMECSKNPKFKIEKLKIKQKSNNNLLLNNKYYKLSKGLKENKDNLKFKNLPEQHHYNKRLLNFIKQKHKEKHIKANFIQKNKQFVQKLNNINSFKKLDYFSRKVLFDNYLKRYLSPDKQKQKKGMFGDLEPLNKKNFRKGSLTERNFHSSHKKSRQNTFKSSKKSMPRLFCSNSFKSNKKLFSKTPQMKNSKSKKLEKLQSAKSIFKPLDTVTPSSKYLKKTPKMDMSPFNVRFKKVFFDKNNLNEILNLKSNNSPQGLINYNKILAESFSNPKNLKVISLIENILEGNEDSMLKQKEEIFSSTSTSANVDLLKYFNKFSENYKALNTKKSYVLKYKKRLNDLIEKYY